jgi:hypothetical protein
MSSSTLYYITASIIIPEFQQTFLTTVFPDHALELLKVSIVHTICYLHVLLPESTLNLKNSNGMHETPMLRYRLQTNCNGWIGKESGSRQF